MKSKSLQIFFSVILSGCMVVLTGCGAGVDMAPRPVENLLVDDFATLDGVSAFGTSWEKYTDQVMGGISNVAVSFENINGKNCIHMQGNVSLENRGGFIMASLDLDKNGKAVDLRGYKGVRIDTIGNGLEYYVQLRTSDNWFPWQFYMAKFTANSSWETLDIPFENFVPENTSKAFDVSKVKKIAILAYKKAFKADVAASKLEFYIED